MQSTRHQSWLNASAIPLIGLLVVGAFAAYVEFSPLPEGMSKPLESFSLQNELLLVTYITGLLAALSWWAMLSLYGKGAFSKDKIWPSLFTVGSLLTLGATLVFVMSIFGSDEDLSTKLFGFLLAASATLILCLKDHQQLTSKTKKKA
jgi:hypothetical protein